jgi:hypothetical protein
MTTFRGRAMAKLSSPAPAEYSVPATRPQGNCQRCGQRTGRNYQARYCIRCKDAIDNAKDATDLAKLHRGRQPAT